MSCPIVRRVLLVAFVAPYGWLHLGFFVHRSRDPAVLGLWSIRYATILLLLAAPYAFFPTVARFLSEPGRYPDPGGGVRVVPVRRKILFLAIVLGALLCATEAWLRSRVPGIDPGPGGAYMTHAFLQHAHRPGARFVAGPIEVEYNRYGFRGPELEEVEPPGEFRIFCLGGSTVAQWNQEDGLDWPSMLAARLRERHPDRRIVVENAAVSGYASLHSLYAYEATIRHLSPDLVIVYHGVNDLIRGFSPQLQAEGPYRDDYGHYFFALKAPIDRGRHAIWIDWRRSLVLSRTHDWAKGWLLSSWFTEAPSLRPFETPQPFAPESFRSLPAFRRHMASLVRAVRSDGVKILVATQPTLLHDGMTPDESGTLWMNLAFTLEDGRYLSPKGFTDGMRQFNDAVRELAKEEAIPFCDLEAGVPKDLRHFIDEVHPTGEGLRRTAELLDECLAREGLLETR